MTAAQNASGFRVLHALLAGGGADAALQAESEHLAQTHGGLDVGGSSVAVNLAMAAGTLMRAIDTIGNVPAGRLLEAVADRNAEVCFLQDVHEQLGGTGPYLPVAPVTLPDA